MPANSAAEIAFANGLIEGLADKHLAAIKAECQSLPLTRAVLCRMALLLRDIEQICEVPRGAAASAPAFEIRRRRARHGKFWTDEMVEKLHQLYAQRLPDSVIAAQLGDVTTQQVSTRISWEIKNGLMKRLDRSANKRRLHRKGGAKALEAHATQPVGEVMEYEENGQTVRRFPAGYAFGAEPQQTAKGKM